MGLGKSGSFVVRPPSERTLSFSGTRKTDWFLVGNGGMGYWDYYRDYHRDPFPHSLLRTREKKEGKSVIR